MITALLVGLLLHSVQAAPSDQPIRLYVGLPTDIVIDADDLGAKARADTVADIIAWAKKEKEPKWVIVGDKESAQAELYITFRAMTKTGRRVKAWHGGLDDELAYSLKAQMRIGDKAHDFAVNETDIWGFKDTAGRLLARVERFVENNRALLFR